MKYGLIGVIAVEPESAMRKIACEVSGGTSSSMSSGTMTGAMIAHIAEPEVMSTLTTESTSRTRMNTTHVGRPRPVKSSDTETETSMPMFVHSKYSRNWAMAKKRTRTPEIDASP